MSAHRHACSHAFDVGHDDFETAVVQASHQMPILVDFWADWCGPCHALTPHLYRVMDDYDGRLRLAQLEVDEGDNMKIAGRFRVRGFPTVMLFCAGEEQGRFSGARSTPQIRDWLEQHLIACPRRS
jgi:putative thioredoxin